MAIQVTTRDTETGQEQTMTIENDYVLVTAGSCYTHHVAAYPSTGTHVITVKGRKDKGR